MMFIEMFFGLSLFYFFMFVVLVGAVTLVALFSIAIYYTTPYFIRGYIQWRERNFTTEQLAYCRLISRKAARMKRKEKVDESQL